MTKPIKTSILVLNENNDYYIKHMKTKVHLQAPTKSALRELGRNINEARRRRRIPIAVMADRAGVSRTTIAKIEIGDPTVSMGGYASVLFVLGMTDSLRGLADPMRDEIGHRLEKERLPRRICLPRKLASTNGKE